MNELTNYYTPFTEMVAQLLCEKLGAKLAEVNQLRSHNNFISSAAIVIWYRTNDQGVTSYGTHNLIIPSDKPMYLSVGHYDIPTLEEARADRTETP